MQAYKDYESMCGSFLTAVDSKMEEAHSDLVALAKTTLVERRIVDALVKELDEITQKKTIIKQLEEQGRDFRHK